jgi:hypothetical protein
MGIYGRTEALAARVKEAAEKVVSAQESRPQRLKPHSNQCSYRSGKPLRHPKSSARASFSATSETRALHKTR